MMCLLSCHYYGVKTTWGVDSQFARCRIHTGPAAYPLRRQSYASTARPGVAGRAAPADAGATPRSDDLVRARGQARFHTLAPALQGSLPSHGSLRTASGSSITHVMSVTYTFSDFARPPISSAVLNRLSRALRGRERMAIACAPVLPAPSAAFRAANAGAPEAPVGRDPGGFGPFRGRGRPRGGSWRPSEPTSRRWVTHRRTPGSSAELPSTFSFGGAEDRGSTAA